MAAWVKEVLLEPGELRKMQKDDETLKHTWDSMEAREKLEGFMEPQSVIGWGFVSAQVHTMRA